jgi:hypothetical protein
VHLRVSDGFEHRVITPYFGEETQDMITLGVSVREDIEQD